METQEQSRFDEKLSWVSEIWELSADTHRVGFALAAQDFGDAKVSNLDDHAVLVQQNVLSL